MELPLLLVKDRLSELRDSLGLELPIGSVGKISGAFGFAMPLKSITEHWDGSPWP
jgi:hypothetical protein